MRANVCNVSNTPVARQAGHSRSTVLLRGVALLARDDRRTQPLARPNYLMPERPVSRLR